LSKSSKEDRRDAMERNSDTYSTTRDAIVSDVCSKDENPISIYDITNTLSMYNAISNVSTFIYTTFFYKYTLKENMKYVFILKF
jgi:hypothetical protein